MTPLYLQIAQSLRKHCPEVQWIDIDKGQLSQLEADDLIEDLPATPFLLVSLPDETWQNLTHPNQIGVGRLIVTLVLHLPSHTHAADPLLSMSVEALDLATKVHEAILLVPDIHHRTRTARQPVAHLYAVSHTYEVRTKYIQQPKTTPKPPPQISTVLTFPSTPNHLNQ